MTGAAPHVRMTVYCGAEDYGCGAVIGTFTDEITEKYPFYCWRCEQTTEGKYPFTIKAEVIGD